MSPLEIVATVAIMAFLVHVLRPALDEICDSDRYYRAGFDDGMRLGIFVARDMTDDEIAELMDIHGWGDEPWR